MSFSKIIEFVRGNLPKSYDYFGLKNYAIWLARQIAKSKLLGRFSGIIGWIAQIALGFVFDKIEPYVRSAIAWAKDKVQSWIDNRKHNKAETKRKEGKDSGNEKEVTDSFDELP